MRRAATLILIQLMVVGMVAAQLTWKADPANSNIQFEVTHLSISSVTGKFNNIKSVMTTKNGQFEGAEIVASVLVDNISTGELMRDKHLKEDDFFNAVKFPMISFKSTSFTQLSGSEYLLKGELTIRDVTKSISFTATYGGTIEMANKSICVFRGGFTINRFDYNLKWNDTLDTGSLIVGSDVSVDINLEFVGQK